MLYFIIANKDMTKFYVCDNNFSDYISDFPELYGSKQEADALFNLGDTELIKQNKLYVQPVKLLQQTY